VHREDDDESPPVIGVIFIERPVGAVLQEVRAGIAADQAGESPAGREGGYGSDQRGEAQGNGYPLVVDAQTTGYLEWSVHVSIVVHLFIPYKMGRKGRHQNIRWQLSGIGGQRLTADLFLVIHNDRFTEFLLNRYAKMSYYCIYF